MVSMLFVIFPNDFQLKIHLEMKLRRCFLQIVSLVIIIPSVSAVCEYNITDDNKIYNYNLAGFSKKFPHGVLSEDGYYQVASNGTVVWFQLCDAMIFNHEPPRCLDCWECGGSSRCGSSCSALMSYNLFGYPVCTTMGTTQTMTIDLIDKRSPHMGLVVKMWHKGTRVNCSLAVSVVCDSKQVQEPKTLERVGFCSYITQMRHPSGCANIVSENSNHNGFGWFYILLIIIVCLVGAFVIAIAAYYLFFLGIRGVNSAFIYLVGRFRGSEGYQRSYSPILS